MPQSRKRTAEGEPGSPPPAIVGGTTGAAGTAGMAGMQGAAGAATTTAAAAPSPSPAGAGGGGVAAATMTPALRPRRRLLRIPKLEIGVSPPAPGVGGATEATITVHRVGSGVPGGRTRTVLEGSRRADILQCAVVAELVAKVERRLPPPAAAGGGVGGTPPPPPSPPLTGTAAVGAGATTTGTAAGAPGTASPPRAVLVRLPLANHASFDAFLDALADTRAAAATDADVDADTTVDGGDAAAATDGNTRAARPATPLRTPGGGGGGGGATTPAGGQRTPARPPPPPGWVRRFRGVLELSHRLDAPAVQARYVALVAAGFDGVGWASPHLDVLAADALCPDHAPWPAGVVEAVAKALRLLASRPDYRDELPTAADADGSPSAGDTLSASVSKSVRFIWRWGGGSRLAAMTPPSPDVLPPVVRLLVQDELAPATRGQLAALDPAFGHPVSAPPTAGWPRTLSGGGSAMVGLLPGSASPLTTGGQPSPAAAPPPSGGRSGETPASWRRLMVRRTVAVATPAIDDRTRRALRYAPTT